MDMSITERYLNAGNSQDLSVRSERRGDVDALVEVAWSRSKVGAAFMQLVREWDAAARDGLRFEQSFLRLKALPEVRGAMVMWALGNSALPPRREQFEEANDLSWAVLTWLLDPTCKACGGTGWVTRANTPNNTCGTCHGTREAVIPRGDRGRGLVVYIEDQVYRARASTKARAEVER